VTYRVRQEAAVSAGGFDLVLPVLMVDWQPEDSREELFIADVGLPSSFGVVEHFPTVPLAVRAEGGSIRHALSLPVVPSFLRMRGRDGPRPVLTFGRMVDLGIVLFLVLLTGYGWRAMRRPVDTGTE
jgi:hypothetical protein